MYRIPLPIWGAPSFSRMIQGSGSMTPLLASSLQRGLISDSFRLSINCWVNEWKKLSYEKPIMNKWISSFPFCVPGSDSAFGNSFKAAVMSLFNLLTPTSTAAPHFLIITVLQLTFCHTSYITYPFRVCVFYKNGIVFYVVFWKILFPPNVMLKSSPVLLCVV